MRTGNHFATITKPQHPRDKLREQLERDTKAFLESGGKIETVSGFEKIKYVSPMEKDSKKANAKKKRQAENASLYGRSTTK